MKPWTKTDQNTGRFIKQYATIVAFCPCGVKFETSETRVRDGRGKYCSKSCLYKYRDNKSAEDHPTWRSNPSYNTIHKWVSNKFGHPMQCEWCGFKSNNPYQIHWANLTGQYKRDRDDWARLCAKCHWHYDREGLVHE